MARFAHHSARTKEESTQETVRPTSALRNKVAHLLRLVGLIMLVAMSIFAALFLLIPYYGTGGYYPALQPGWFPTKPHEFDSISRFRGTIWEGNQILRHLFWGAACQLWCIYIPVWAFTLGEIFVSWPALSQRSKRIRIVGVVIAALIGVLWFIASWRLTPVYFDLEHQPVTCAVMPSWPAT